MTYFDELKKSFESYSVFLSDESLEEMKKLAMEMGGEDEVLLNEKIETYKHFGLPVDETYKFNKRIFDERSRKTLIGVLENLQIAHRKYKMENNVDINYSKEICYMAQNEKESNYIDELITLETKDGICLYENQGLERNDVENMDENFLQDFQEWQKDYCYIENGKPVFIEVRGSVLEKGHIKIFATQGDFTFDFIKSNNDKDLNYFQSLVYSSKPRKKMHPFFSRDRKFIDSIYEDEKVSGYKEIDHMMIENVKKLGWKKISTLIVSKGAKEFSSDDYKNFANFKGDIEALQKYTEKMKQVENLLKENASQLEYKKMISEKEDSLSL